MQNEKKLKFQYYIEMSHKKKFFCLVLSELEGLSKGANVRDLQPLGGKTNPQHIARVAENAKIGLQFARSRNPAIKCVTTKGTILASSSFTTEDDPSQVG